MARLDRASPWAAAGLAAFLQPWTLVAAGAATITQAKLSGPADYLTLVLFVLLATASFLYPRAVRDVRTPAAAGRQAASVADLAGHPPRPGHHLAVPAARPLAGRQQPLLPGVMTGGGATSPRPKICGHAVARVDQVAVPSMRLGSIAGIRALAPGVLDAAEQIHERLHRAG